jgi:hypothetical protein
MRSLSLLVARVIVDSAFTAELSEAGQLSRAFAIKSACGHVKAALATVGLADAAKR